ncbi:serine-rich adhesin for platelets-like [Clytia hemisphaerica]
MVSLPRPKIFRKRSKNKETPSPIERFRANITTFFTSIFFFKQADRPTARTSPKPTTRQRFLNKVRKSQNKISPCEIPQTNDGEMPGVQKPTDVAVCTGHGISPPQQSADTKSGGANKHPDGSQTISTSPPSLNQTVITNGLKSNEDGILHPKPNPALSTSPNDTTTNPPSLTDIDSNEGCSDFEIRNTSTNNLLIASDSNSQENTEKKSGENVLTSSGGDNDHKDFGELNDVQHDSKSNGEESLRSSKNQKPLSPSPLISENYSTKTYSLQHTSEGSQMPVMKTCIPLVKKAKIPNPKNVPLNDSMEKENPDPASPSSPISDSPVCNGETKSYQLRHNSEGSQLPTLKSCIPLVKKSENKPINTTVEINESDPKTSLPRTVDGSQLPISKTSVPLKPRKPKRKKKPANLAASGEVTIKGTQGAAPKAVIDSRFVAAIGRNLGKNNRDSSFEANNIVVDSAVDLPDVSSTTQTEQEDDRQTSNFGDLFEVLNLATGILPGSNDSNLDKIKASTIFNDSGIKIDREKTKDTAGLITSPRKLPPLKAIPNPTYPAIQSDFPEFSEASKLNVEPTTNKPMDSDMIAIASRNMAANAIDNAINDLFNQQDF